VVVLDGHPTLRHPEGEDVLSPGEVVCFPPGPQGAHQLANRGQEPVRLLMLSTMIEPNLGFYPDSDKVGVFDVGDGQPEPLLFRRSDAVDYFDGELH
jgi:uncharacterized cupin superfamily protein